MADASKTCIPEFPHANGLVGAWLDDLQVLKTNQQTEIVLLYQEFQADREAELCWQDGVRGEHIRGHYIPRGLRFLEVEDLTLEGLYQSAASIPDNHMARSLRGMLTWYPTGDKRQFFILANGSPEAELMFFASGYQEERRDGERRRYEGWRNWSPGPPLFPGTVYIDTPVRRKYAGDPVQIRLNGARYDELLFVGGIEEQKEYRPEVGAVLNLSENPSRWAKDRNVNPMDRWEIKGEGSGGMNVEDFLREASWVLERLEKGQRVLVHCSAGMNRSSSVCCAALILAEGIPAEAALARVREHHPWARPDSFHWLQLRHLAAEVAQNRT